MKKEADLDASDELAIRNLIARVAWETDTWSSAESYTANYTEDCSWQIEGITEPYVGHEGLMRRITEMLEQGICGPSIPSRHCIASLEVIPQPGHPKRAIARSMAVMVVNREGRCEVGTFGDYEDLCECVGGKWLLSRRMIRVPGA